MTWHEWDGTLGPDSPVVLVRDGDRDGGLDLLAHALRADGVAQNLAHAYRLAETANYVHTYYGFVEDDRWPMTCDETGLTADGSHVQRAQACVFALIDED